jgi:hypothetical protein
MSDHLLNNTEAAELLSISPRTLFLMRERSEIPIAKLADSRKKFRYSAKALEKFIAESATDQRSGRGRVRHERAAQLRTQNVPEHSIGDAVLGFAYAACRTRLRPAVALVGP